MIETRRYHTENDFREDRPRARRYVMGAWGEDDLIDHVLKHFVPL